MLLNLYVCTRYTPYLGSPIPQTKKDHISKTKSTTITASKMLIFSALFRNTDRRQGTWRRYMLQEIIYVLMNEILQIHLDTVFSKETLAYFTIVIQKHYQMVREVFLWIWDRNIILSYTMLGPRLISEVRYLRWPKRFEAFHKTLVNC